MYLTSSSEHYLHISKLHVPNTNPVVVAEPLWPPALFAAAGSSGTSSSRRKAKGSRAGISCKQPLRLLCSPGRHKHGADCGATAEMKPSGMQR